MQRLFLCFVLASALCIPAIAQEPGLDHTMYRMPIPGGFAVTPDLVQLIVSQPSAAELVYFDTLTEKEIRRVEMEFQPGAMALRDESLFVIGNGSSVIYEVAWKTGKVRKEFTIPGDGISRIAVHPKRPLVFVSTTNLEVFAVDVTTGKSHKTKASGDHLAVSPDGVSLFTGMQPRSSDGVLLITETPDGSIHFIYDRWGIRAALAKYKIKDFDLDLTSSQPNASVNGYLMHLSPDGKRLMMTGGGGWRPPAEGGAGGGYVTAIFDTNNLSSKLGQAPHAEAVVYHPVLNFAAGCGFGHNLVLFDGKSFKEKQTIVFSEGGRGGHELLAFVGKGTKVALYNGANPKAPTEGLHFFDIDLSKEERTQLTKAYGKLPLPLEASPKKPLAQKPKVEKPTKNASKTAASKEAPAASGTSPDGSRILEAKAGFNDADGINSNGRKNSPYAFGVKGFQQGNGEAGWDTPWSPNDNLSFQAEVVAEGDGALFLRGTANTGRKLSAAYKNLVRVEQSVRLPPDGDLKVYISQDENATAAMWFAGEGKFVVLDGVGEQYGSHKKLDTRIKCEADKWYHVVVDVDLSSKTWTFSVDGTKFDKTLHFRGRAEVVQAIGLLSEKPAGAYVDAIQISDLSDNSRQTRTDKKK